MSPRALDGRITGRPVAPLFPARGPVRILLMGEAPGPRGADQSGIPFWGDRAGKLVYRALALEGLAEVPEAAWEPWDGARFSALCLAPKLREVALTNALACCPTSDGRTFRAPSDRELREKENLARIAGELARARARCPSRLRVIAFGKRAHWLLSQGIDLESIELHGLPHPSAQGLLQAAPQKGKGLKLSDLQMEWQEKLRALLRG